jgi:hypothetical protein
MRRIKKPCPGCGEPDLYREPDKVCRECRRLLDRVKAIEISEAAGENNLVGVQFGERYHWNEYIYTRGDFESRVIMEAFFNLARAAAKPSLNSVNDYDKDILILGRYDRGGETRSLMDKGIAEAIRDLRELIDPLIDSAYKAGKEDGHNLLMRLATGDLAPNEFLQETEEEEE